MFQRVKRLPHAMASLVSGGTRRQRRSQVVRTTDGYPPVTPPDSPLELPEDRLGATRVEADHRVMVAMVVGCLLVAVVSAVVVWGRPGWAAALGTAPWVAQVALGATVAVALIAAALWVSRPR
jgi:hypothetical protein